MDPYGWGGEGIREEGRTPVLCLILAGRTVEPGPASVQTSVGRKKSCIIRIFFSHSVESILKPRGISPFSLCKDVTF